MYERLTGRFSRVLKRASQEAIHLKHEYIGTEHLLLGLLQEGSGAAAGILRNLGVDFPSLRLHLESIITPGAEAVPLGKYPFTPRAKDAIDFAVEEARCLNLPSVGTGHLLLGLIRTTDSVASQVLVRIGVSADRIQDEITDP